MPNNLPTAHMIVKNEDVFVWYAINSVLPYVDKIIIFDTGSSDKTVEIIKSIKSRKICFKQFEINNVEDISELRQKQLEMTDGSWFWMVDGDEIYPDSLCKEIINLISTKGDKIDGIVVKRFDLLGDIYHYQSEKVGTYSLFGTKGHLAIRLLNKKNLPGLHVKGKYPYEGYYDSKEIEVIYHPPEKFLITGARLFHAMYLKRSTRGVSLSDTYHRNKYKIESGHKFDTDQNLPEVFKADRPPNIADATVKRSYLYELTAAFITPIKAVKRKIFNLS